MELGSCAIWQVVATIAAILSALAAFLALRSSARAVDVSSYLDIVGRLQAFERRLEDAASDPDQHVFALREYANFLDGMAHLHNTGRFGRNTAALCWDALCNSIAALEMSEETTNVLEKSFTSRETFAHLIAFRKRHKSKYCREKDNLPQREREQRVEVAPLLGMYFYRSVETDTEPARKGGGTQYLNRLTVDHAGSCRAPPESPSRPKDPSLLRG